jgi:hypothetical protein
MSGRAGPQQRACPLAGRWLPVADHLWPGEEEADRNPGSGLFNEPVLLAYRLSEPVASSIAGRQWTRWV